MAAYVGTKIKCGTEKKYINIKILAVKNLFFFFLTLKKGLKLKKKSFTET